MRVLFLSHSHPSLQAGGTEIFSLDLFRELRSRRGVSGVYLAGTSSGQRSGAPGTAFQAIGSKTDELLMWTAGFDGFHLSQTDLHGVVPEFVSFLRELRPEIVHVHHVLQLGIEVLPLIRRVLPAAVIVLTLHDYYAICAHDGQMYTTSGLPCAASSIDACHRCLPDHPATDFRLRELQVRGAFRAVDRFISPSDFLRRRFIEWGIPAASIAVIRNGIPAQTPAPARPDTGGGRNRFGFFGHINRFKGATVALAASARLSRDGIAHQLSVHGGTAYQARETVDAFEGALVEARDAVHHGAYARAEQPKLISGMDWVIVPSVWWENAPLVIQEAFAHRRPVVCADVGGMAEAVRDGIDGLHFARGDARSLADTMRRGIEQTGLWQKLTDGISSPRTVREAAEDHIACYANLMAGARASLGRAA